MKFTISNSKYLKLLIGLLSVNTTLAFSAVPVFPGHPVYSRTVVAYYIRDAPKLVNIKFAVLTPENTLKSIESSTNYNVAPGTGFASTTIRVAEDLPPGINYYVVVIDAENPNNYVTNGPFPITSLGGGLPSTSVTSDSGTTYSTAGDSGSPSATVQQLSSSSGSISTQTPTSSPTSSPTPKPTPNSTTATQAGTTNVNKATTTEPGSSTGLSVGVIAGIAVGAAVGGAIIALCAFCILFKKYRQPPLPVETRPHQEIKNNSAIPLTASASEVVKVDSAIKPTSTTTTVVPTPKQPKTNTTIDNSSPTTLSTAVPEYNYVNNLNASSETTFKYQYPVNFSAHPDYPPYVYPHNLHQYNMSSYPPSGDAMPIPEHHFGANNVYPPLSPTFYNYPQPYPPYQPHQSVQINTASNPFYSSSAAAKTEESTSKTADSLLAQKVENTTDDKIEYHQKPDAAVDEHLSQIKEIPNLNVHI